VLRQALAEQLPQRLHKLEDSWEELERQSWSEEGRLLFQRQLESLAGSSEIFGFAEVAAAARALETSLHPVPGRPGPPTAEERRAVQVALAQLRRTCVESAGGVQPTQLLDPASEAAVQRRQAKKILFLLGRDADLAADLAFQVGCFGFLLRRFDTVEELRRVVEENPPAAILVEAEPFAPRLEEAARLSAQLADRDQPVPLVILGTRTDFESRLQVVRAGAADYLLRPPDVRRLVERLDLLSHAPAAEPYRILVLEGEYRRALEHSLTLQQAGMTTLLLADPGALLDQMVDFDPDLLLMDFAGTRVRGVELAAVVRQEGAFPEVSIVLVSEERTLSRQLEALHSGADDFLRLPVDPAHLVSALTYFAQRSRSLRRFIARDALTGCLNHSRLVERLVIEVDQARRHGRNCAYAMIDLDHLQAINDHCGHLAGDAVLKSLVRLAEQRLRRSDVIGRYGGDELGIILPGTSGSDAARVIDEVRALFVELRQYSGDTQFTASFSCGIGTFPEAPDALALHRAALGALDRAHDQGRNCVVLAEVDSVGLS
jgi:diguanylate cyclase (GGDEF)-like protein